MPYGPRSVVPRARPAIRGLARSPPQRDLRAVGGGPGRRRLARVEAAAALGPVVALAAVEALGPGPRGAAPPRALVRQRAGHAGCSGRGDPRDRGDRSRGPAPRPRSGAGVLDLDRRQRRGPLRLGPPLPVRRPRRPEGGQGRARRPPAPRPARGQPALHRPRRRGRAGGGQGGGRPARQARRAADPPRRRRAASQRAGLAHLDRRQEPAVLARGHLPVLGHREGPDRDGSAPRDRAGDRGALPGHGDQVRRLDQHLDLRARLGDLGHGDRRDRHHRPGLPRPVVLLPRGARGDGRAVGAVRRGRLHARLHLGRGRPPQPAVRVPDRDRGRQRHQPRAHHPGPLLRGAARARPRPTGRARARPARLAARHARGVAHGGRRLRRADRHRLPRLPALRDHRRRRHDRVLADRVHRAARDAGLARAARPDQAPRGHR